MADAGAIGRNCLWFTATRTETGGAAGAPTDMCVPTTTAMRGAADKRETGAVVRRAGATDIRGAGAIARGVGANVRGAGGAGWASK